ncbi:MAG: hypothetical protein JNK04_18930, partial [Myxococcales bacterium]|nr:hypothetical protein [Myxococcales bacterium]
MRPSFLVSLCALPLLSFTAACVDTGDLFGGNNSDSGGGPSTGGSPETGAGAPNGGGPTSGGGDVGGAPPGCGDGDIDAGEECDGANLNGQDCTAFGSQSPAGLTCTANCNLDPSG